MGDIRRHLTFDDFDAWADEHCPDAAPSEAFAQWLANVTGRTVIGRDLDGDGIVISMPEETPTRIEEGNA